MKKIIALSLVAGGLAFAQSGLQGGTSGIHQHNAYTLGKGGIELGTGGAVSLDSWSQSRGGVLSINNQDRSFHAQAASLSGNVHVAVGLQEYLDLGVSLPLCGSTLTPKRPGRSSSGVERSSCTGQT